MTARRLEPFGFSVPFGSGFRVCHSSGNGTYGLGCVTVLGAIIVNLWQGAEGILSPIIQRPIFYMGVSENRGP